MNVLRVAPHLRHSIPALPVALGISGRKRAVLQRPEERPGAGRARRGCHWPASLLPYILFAALSASRASCSAPIRSVLRSPAASNRWISYDPQGFSVRGHRLILLAGTVQYQRIPCTDWARALDLFARAGFNTVDLLVPWNEHEPSEGRFDFDTPQKNLNRFLRLCRARGLFVLLRAGPYICDEYDGGGIPAWMYPQRGLEVRQNNAAYLRYAVRYLHHLDHVVKPFLVTHGGPIILYQLENELDFHWSCRDRAGYMTTLRNAVRQDGIDVPLTACIGNGNHISAATGDVSGLLPTDNLYVQHRVEERAIDAERATRDHVMTDGQSLRDVPLFVSETDRSPLILRRLLAGGAKGVSPFNFAGGLNLDRANGLTEWDGSTPVSTAVDFGGMIGFDLQPRDRWFEARRLARAVHCFSDLLATSAPVESSESTFTVSNASLGSEDRRGGPGGLWELHAPGTSKTQFLFLLNNTSQAQSTTVKVENLRFPSRSTLKIAPWSDPILPVHLSLARWGAPIELEYSTAEVREIHGTPEGLSITFGSPADSAVELALSGARSKGHAGSAAGDWREILSWPSGENRTDTRVLPDGRKLQIRIEEDTPAAKNNPGSVKSVALQQPDRSGREEPASMAGLFTPFAGPTPPSLESAGILRGAGWYRIRFQVADPGRFKTLRLEVASGFTTVYLNGVPLGFNRGVGTALEIPLRAVPSPKSGNNGSGNNGSGVAGGSMLKSGSNILEVRVEIWGHANFGNASPPVNHLGSLRGLLGPVVLKGTGPDQALASGELAPDLLDHLLESHLKSAPPGLETSRISVGGRDPSPGCTPYLEGRAAGDFRWATSAIPTAERSAPGGDRIRLSGRDVFVTLYAGKQLIGRVLLGPQPEVNLVGGPRDELYLSPEHARMGLIGIEVEGTAPDWRLDPIELTPLQAPVEADSNRSS